jgi:hypothetical protein
MPRRCWRIMPGRFITNCRCRHGWRRMTGKRNPPSSIFMHPEAELDAASTIPPNASSRRRAWAPPLNRKNGSIVVLAAWRNPRAPLHARSSGDARNRICRRVKRTCGEAALPMLVHAIGPTAPDLSRVCIDPPQLLSSQCRLSSLNLHRSDCRFGDPARKTHRR